MALKYTLLFILLIASSADLLVPVLLGRRLPGYSHLIDTISALGTNGSPVKKWGCATLIAVGVLFIVFALGLAHVLGTTGWSRFLFIFGIVVYGLGCILAGLFPEDPRGAVETASGRIHGIASGLGFICLILNPLWAFFINEFERCFALNVLFLALAMASFALFIVSENRETGWLQYTGLYQRINLITLYACLAVNYSAVL